MKRNNKQKGVTLIEAIISVALLSILIIPISALVTNSAKTNKKAEVKQRAVYIGQKMLEEVKAYDGMNLRLSTFLFLDGGTIIKSGSNYEADLTRTVDGYTGGKKYKVKLTLEQDDNFNFSGSNNKGENSDADQIINISQDGEIIKGEVNSIKTTIGSDLVLKVTEPMNINLYNRGESVPIINSVKVSTNNKIMLYLEGSFNKNINLQIENNKIHNVDIYVVKNSGTTANINITSDIGQTMIYENLLEIEESQIGGLYKVNVQVMNEDGSEKLFEGSTKVNLNIK